MNHDVPHPTTATRSPRRGSSPATSGASWEASSASIQLPSPSAPRCTLTDAAPQVFGDTASAAVRGRGCAVMLDIYQKQSQSGTVSRRPSDHLFAGHPRQAKWEAEQDSTLSLGQNEHDCAITYR